MKKKILNDHNVNPFWIIRDLPDVPLFKDCPIKPSEETILAAEELYLKFSYDPPHYVSSCDEYIILEWYYPSRIHPKMCKELVVKDPINLEWRVYEWDAKVNAKIQIC